MASLGWVLVRNVWVLSEMWVLVRVAGLQLERSVGFPSREARTLCEGRWGCWSKLGLPTLTESVESDPGRYCWCQSSVV